MLLSRASDDLGLPGLGLYLFGFNAVSAGVSRVAHGILLLLESSYGLVLDGTEIFFRDLPPLANTLSNLYALCLVPNAKKTWT